MSMNIPWIPAILHIIAISLHCTIFTDITAQISPARMRVRKGFESIDFVGDSEMEPMFAD